MKIPPQDLELSEFQKENIKRWVAILRSGEYDRTTSFLKHRDGDGVIRHCCLGVACEIKDVPNTIIQSNRNDEAHYSFVFGEDLYNRYPDDQWFMANYGFLVHHKLTSHHKLAVFNDDGFSFLQIADIIETCILNNKELEVKENG